MKIISIENIENQILEIILSNSLGNEEVELISKYCCIKAGKRIRPRLLGMVCNFLSNISKNVINKEVLINNIDESKIFYTVSALIEIIHASSLIHDDLPALDNDDFRRGNPSCHKKFGEAEAILIGDFLVSIITIAVNQLTSTSILVRNNINQELAIAYRNICLGQFLDIKNSSKNFAEIKQVYFLKTASLFATTFKLSGVLCGVSENIQNYLYQLGTNFGTLFQIENDLIDRDNNTLEMGRFTNSDLKNNKKSLISLTSHSELQIFIKDLLTDNKFIINKIMAEQLNINQSYPDSLNTTASTHVDSFQLEIQTFIPKVMLMIK